jgi:heme-degrading monooxygenase HmoA
MIARIWHGITRSKDAEEYLDYLKRTGVPDSKGTEGNRGVYVLREIDGEKAHFLFISLWNSTEAIGRFAGSEIDRARYYPEDEKFLLELEPFVEHYEVLVKP